MSVTILVARSWSIVDKVLAQRAPRRRATMLPAPWVDELMSKRFGCLMICSGCETKYRDALRRHGYARHPEMKGAGNACDFCKDVFDQIPLFFAEEKRAALSSTRAESAALSRRSAALPPDLFGQLRRGA